MLSRVDQKFDDVTETSYVKFFQTLMYNIDNDALTSLCLINSTTCVISEQENDTNDHEFPSLYTEDDVYLVTKRNHTYYHSRKIFNKSEFKLLSTQLWLDVVLQIFKLFVLSRVTIKVFEPSKVNRVGRARGISLRGTWLYTMKMNWPI